jgi:DNA-binding transcriptional ArsR family regulator
MMPPEPPTAEAQRPLVTITDPRAIRALAHKVRLEVIDELFGSEQTYTATELANSFGLTPSAMSYHLRALEKWGYLVRAASVGDARERHWRAAGNRLQVGDNASSSALVSTALLDLTLTSTRARVVAAIRLAGNIAANERPPLEIATAKVALTRAEARDFLAEYAALVEKYRLMRHQQEPAEPRRPMHLLNVLAPDGDSSS